MDSGCFAALFMHLESRGEHKDDYVTSTDGTLRWGEQSQETSDWIESKMERSYFFDMGGYRVVNI